jgi:transposase
MRSIALDVHRDFCEVAIAEGGEVRFAGRVQTDPEALALFAGSLAATDEVALEATGNALAIARIIGQHVARVVLADPRAVRGSASTALKTDKVDARTLARLLAGGLVAEVWLPDERTRRLRRLVSRRAQLVRQRTRSKNQVHAALIRNLKARQPMRDLFGVAGRRWLAAQTLPEDEEETIASCLREIDFLAGEIEQIERSVALEVLACEQMRRLLTLPGISGVAACTLVSAVGDIARFPRAGQLVGYFGLRAYPGRASAVARRQVMRPQASCSRARWFSGFFDQRTSRPRKRLSQEWVRSTTQRRARKPASRSSACFSSPRERTCGVSPYSSRSAYTSG